MKVQIDVDMHREDMIDYYGSAAFVGSPFAMGVVIAMDDASPEQLIHRSPTFKQIENIIGAKLPKSAYSTTRRFWNASSNASSVRSAWTAADWSLVDLDIEGQTIKLVDNLPSYTWAYMPPELTEHRIPDDCEYELSKFLAYLIKKYGLKKTK